MDTSIITGYNHLSKGIFGDIRFRAPEVLQNKHYDFRADSWSFGIIIFLMLTGRFPFDNYEYTQIPVGSNIEDFPERIQYTDIPVACNNIQESDLEKIENRIINDEPPLYFIADKGHNKMALDIVSKLLVKNPE